MSYVIAQSGAKPNSIIFLSLAMGAKQAGLVFILKMG